MKEVLNRRFVRALKDENTNMTLPDLILIDGGKGQYSVSRETLNDLGLHELPIIAIAKVKIEMLVMKLFFMKIKILNLKKMTLFFSFFKDLEMRHTGLQ